MSLSILFNLATVNSYAITPSLQGAKYVMSWQLDSGGWSKDNPNHYTRYWNGTEKKAAYYQSNQVTPLGTIDNMATIGELTYLVDAYQLTKDATIKKSILKGLGFLMTMQYETGGFPQVYPKQDTVSSAYENDATFNDEATVNVLKLLKNVMNKESGFSSDLIDSNLYYQLKTTYDKGIDFILKAQVVVNGVKTAWSGHHNPYTYAATKGRSFEPVALISRESVAIVDFLKSLNSTDSRIQTAILSAEIWFVKTVVLNKEFNYGGSNNVYYLNDPGKYMWYRYYEIGTNKALFGDTDGSVHYDIHEISKEKANYYGWAGNWGKYIYLDAIARNIGQTEPPTASSFLTSGNSYIDKTGIYFIESGVDSIITPLMETVEVGDTIKIVITISDTNRTTSELKMANTGFRTGSSVWNIGHGTTTKTIQFDITKEFDDQDKFIEFYIAGGKNGESITLKELKVYVNDQLTLNGFNTAPTIPTTPVESTVVSSVGTFVSTGASSIDSKGFHFVSGDSGYIKSPLLTNVKINDLVTIKLTISAASRVTAKLYLDNVGLRSGSSDWTIGYGVSVKTLSFKVLKTLDASEQFLLFEINSGTSKETIDVSCIQIFVNGQLII